MGSRGAASVSASLVVSAEIQFSFSHSKKRVQTYKRFKGTLFIRTNHNKLIFGVIAFIKL